MLAPQQLDRVESEASVGSGDSLRLTYALGRLHSVYRTALVSELRRHELSVPEFTALSVLGSRSGLSNAQLARRTMVTPQAMNKVLASLEAKRLVTRSGSSGSDPRGHHRARVIELTEAGREWLGRAQVGVQFLETMAFEGTTDQERALLVARLQEATRRLCLVVPTHA